MHARGAREPNAAFSRWQLPSPAGCTDRDLAQPPPTPSPGAPLAGERHAEDDKRAAGDRRLTVGRDPSNAAMPKKKAEGDEKPPKAGRQSKRQATAAAADDGAGPSSEAPPAKRPRGRPPKAVSVEPLAPEPVATTAARKLRKAADVSQPASENPANIKAVPTKARRVSRRKRSKELLHERHQRGG
ncbi:hypothetical protein MTO96_020223 [Rhipicephalus appendiculatus]